MNERTTLEIIAPTVEQALAQGLAELGLPAEAVSVEVVDAGNKGLFGLGGRQVRVRLTVIPPGGLPAPPPAPTPRASAPPRQARARRLPRREEHPPRNDVRGEEIASSLPSVAPRNDMAPVPVAGHDEMLDATEAIVSKLVHHLGMQAQVSAHYDDSDEDDDRRRIHVDIRGEDLSGLIGRHAETLNAFQYIASLIVGKEKQQWAQLVVDVEGYRSRRERQLRQLAQRMAEQVLKTGRRATLEPMTAGERRIIHLELRSHPAVATESVGEEPHRKVTVIPKE